MQELANELKRALFNIQVLENKLNHCSQDEVDELIYQLKAEKARYGRIKRELTEVYQEQREGVRQVGK